MKKTMYLTGLLTMSAVLAASAQTSLYTTYEDWQAAWVSQGSQWGNPAPVAVSTFGADASTINGLGNPTAPGGAGTSGIPHNWSWQWWCCRQKSMDVCGL